MSLNFGMEYQKPKVFKACINDDLVDLDKLNGKVEFGQNCFFVLILGPDNR